MLTPSRLALSISCCTFVYDATTRHMPQNACSWESCLSGRRMWQAQAQWRRRSTSMQIHLSMGTSIDQQLLSPLESVVAASSNRQASSSHPKCQMPEIFLYFISGPLFRMCRLSRLHFFGLSQMSKENKYISIRKEKWFTTMETYLVCSG